MAKKYKVKQDESIEPEIAEEQVEDVVEEQVEDVAEVVEEAPKAKSKKKQTSDKQTQADQLREIQRKRLLGLI